MEGSSGSGSSKYGSTTYAEYSVGSYASSFARARRRLLAMKNPMRPPTMIVDTVATTTPTMIGSLDELLERCEWMLAAGVELSGVVEEGSMLGLDEGETLWVVDDAEALGLYNG